jgi:hypothetical protein
MELFKIRQNTQAVGLHDQWRLFKQDGSQINVRSIFISGCSWTDLETVEGVLKGNLITVGHLYIDDDKNVTIYNPFFQSNLEKIHPDLKLKARQGDDICIHEVSKAQGTTLAWNGGWDKESGPNKYWKVVFGGESVLVEEKVLISSEVIGFSVQGVDRVRCKIYIPTRNFSRNKTQELNLGSGI